MLPFSIELKPGLPVAEQITFAVKKAVVAVAEPDSSPLLLVAEHGISSAAIGDFSVTRDDVVHPLIRAMDRTDATYFDGSSDKLRGPIEGLPFHAIPLRADAAASARSGIA